MDMDLLSILKDIYDFSKARNIDGFGFFNYFFGHRFLDTQDKEFIFLEFLNICRSNQENMFNESVVKKLNHKKIDTLLDVYQIHNSFDSLIQSCEEDFSYLKSNFKDYKEFYTLLECIEQILINPNAKKMKSLHPFSLNMVFGLYADDRRNFFARGGELLYLGFCNLENSVYKNELKELILYRYKNNADLRWEKLISLLNNGPLRDVDSSQVLNKNSINISGCEIVFENLAKDLIHLLKSNIVTEDLFSMISNLIALYLGMFIVYKSKILNNNNDKTQIPTEVLNTKSCKARRYSKDIYKINEEDVLSCIINIIQTSTCCDLHELESFIKEADKDYVFYNDLNNVKTYLIDIIKTEYKNNFSGVLRKLFKDAGLVSRDGTNTFRYLLNEELIALLVFLNVDIKMELDKFLSVIYDKYNIFVSDRYIYDESLKSDFKNNKKRFIKKLRKLGYLDEKSDGLLYIVNTQR